MLGLAGGSRCLNRVPRALLVRMDGSTAKNKPSGPSSDPLWRKIYASCVISMFMFMFWPVWVGIGWFSDCWTVAGGPSKRGACSYATCCTYKWVISGSKWVISDFK